LHSGPRRRATKKELLCGDCFLNITNVTATSAREMTLLVQPVFIKLRVGGSFTTRSCTPSSYAGKSVILYNTRDVVLSRGNKERERNVLLSEKMMPGEGPYDAAVRCCVEELLMTQTDILRFCTHQPDETRLQVNKMESKTYVGLTSVYKKHLCVLDVRALDSYEKAEEREAARKWLTKRMGITVTGNSSADADWSVAFADFTSVETNPEKTVEHYWSYVDEEEAYEGKKITGANFDIEF